MRIVIDVPHKTLPRMRRIALVHVITVVTEALTKGGSTVWVEKSGAPTTDELNDYALDSVAWQDEDLVPDVWTNTPPTLRDVR